MTDQELQALVEQVSLSAFQQPFRHQARFNRRLKTTGGRYFIGDHHLDFNPTYAATLSRAEFIGIVKHELCHYHLHLSGRPYQHRSAAFKNLLAQVGGSRYVPATAAPVTKVNKQRYEYVCQSCGQHYRRQRRIDLRRFVCGRCQGRLRQVPLSAS
ncbi:SprT family protein [Lapidilactobacillus luobeiensis]|uniref:SprT family protein n=1 Tax=Lapidilactobacillus luobeiensis TaxID=2950371 RepID=UPI0021C3B117|nr:SprT family protein [Lapidilactobacillus luobeiensis]